jgi:hypothetical protein
MAWTGSKIFRAYLADILANTTAIDLDGTDTLKAALYNNSITPDENVAAANSAFNVAQWANTNEVSQAVQWPTGGVALTGNSVNSGTSDVVFFTSSNIQSGAAATLINAYGMLVYDSSIATPVASQGICFNYFGGVNSITNGQLTVVPNASGILRLTIT